MIDFENLGYINITNENPIHFIECLGEFFETVYPYKERFYKKENDVITILKVGTFNKFTDIAGICYYPKGWYKFEVHSFVDYVDKEFEQTIKAVKFNINKV